MNWLLNLKWIRAIREYDVLIEKVAGLEKERDELEVALMAKAETHSAMAKVLRRIDDHINLAGPNRQPATLRPRPGESARDRIDRHVKSDLVRQLEGREAYIEGLHRVFRNLADRNWRELGVVSENIQADVDIIVNGLRGDA